MAETQGKLKAILEKEGIAYKIFFHEPVMTMADVKRVLGVKMSSTAKTLVIKAKGEVVLVAIPGCSLLSKKKLAGVLGMSRDHLDMVSREEVEKVTNLPIGAIPPFGLGFRVVMDESLLALDRIYCGFATPTESLEINPRDLQHITNAISGDITA